MALSIGQLAESCRPKRKLGWSDALEPLLSLYFRGGGVSDKERFSVNLDNVQRHAAGDGSTQCPSIVT